MIIASINPQVLVEKYDVPKNKILAVPNGADLTLRCPQAKQDKNQKFTLGFVGYLMKTRLDLFLKAVSSFAAKRPDFDVILMGPIFHQNDALWLEQEIKNLSAENQVVIKAGIHAHGDVLQQFAAVDVCVCPYPDSLDISATYPIKLFEYMALGKPIVVTRMWGTSQVIENNKSGILVDPTEPEDMANAFKTFTAQNIDTSSTGKTTIYTCPASTETTIIGLNIANILTSSITVTVEFVDGGTTITHLVKDAIVPVGSSLVVAGGDQKIVMNATDILKVYASQDNSCDAVLSVLEIT